MKSVEHEMQSDRANFLTLYLYSLLMTEYAFEYLVPYIGYSLKESGLVYCVH